jgi:hypothetical protein
MSVSVLGHIVATCRNDKPLVPYLTGTVACLLVKSFFFIITPVSVSNEMNALARHNIYRFLKSLYSKYINKQVFVGAISADHHQG